MYRLDCLCFAPPFRFDLRFMERLALRPDVLVVVAEQGGEMRGFVIYEIDDRKEFSSAYVATLDVHPEYRRLGIAKALMDEADGLAMLAGVNHIRLHVFAGNEAAIRFYEGRGCKRVAVTTDFYGRGLDGILYLKRMSG
jgi:ribosomal protein S18 acetylase RimI-like enzyme